MTVRILTGDCRAVLATLPDASVQCCVTSPPYWGLRSYLPDGHPLKSLEIGSEPTVDEWVTTMVDVFRSVRRVLRDDGTLFLNLGDAYVHGTGADRGPTTTEGPNVPASWSNRSQPQRIRPSAGLKTKDLIGQPWLVAFALRADGWWLRQEIIWSKANPMPESARDRCTKSHEHIFLLSKSERYFWNFDAVQEPASPNTHARMAQNIAAQKGSMRANGGEQAVGGPDARPFKAGGRRNNGVGFGHGYDAQQKPRQVAAVGRRAGPPGNPAEGDRKLTEAGSGTKNNASFDEAMAVMPETRNPRSVWHFPTEPFKGAHFATFPRELAQRCITAGTREGDTVLDPFGGSGTVGVVADAMQRHAVLIDLDERNVPMAQGRIEGDSPLFADVEVTA